MKTKLFLLSIVSIALFAGCNKSDESVGPLEKTKTVAVKFTTPIGPRSVDPPVSGGANAALNNVTIYLASNDVVLDYHTLTPSEIIAGEYRFEQVYTSVNKVLVVANVPAEATLSTTSIAAIQGYAYSIASQQSSESKSGVKHVTLMGSGIPAIADDPISDGHTYMEAEVIISALVARIEMGAVKAGTGLRALNLDAVYINNYYTDATKGSTKLHAQTDAVWVPPFSYTVPEYANDYDARVTNTGEWCYAFQVFAGNLPHVVLRVSGEYENGEIFTNGWVTFTKYNRSTNGTPNYITAMEANNIYNLGAEITINAGNITPFPEMERVDLGVKVKIADWNFVSVTPEV